jgi:hypothetical protein
VFASSNTWHIRNETANAVKAEGNTFGTTVASEIDAKIWDQLDDGTYGRVDYDPLKGGIHPSGNPQPAALSVAGAAALPTNCGAEVVFSLSAPAEVTVEVLNLAGRRVATVAHRTALAAGTQRLVWNGQSDAGTRAPAGRYLVRITARDAQGAQATALCGVTR